jgi:hypothetical protein
MTRPTLDDMRDELEKGRILESDLRSKSHHIAGYCDFIAGQVHVNPRPMIVEALLHELIHRRHPKWSEKTVDREAKALLSKMTEDQVATFYRRYQLLARKRRAPKSVDE